MSYSYQFRLKIITLVTEQDYGIREVAKLHQISHALVIYWLKAFRERRLDGVKSPYTLLQPPKIVKQKMKKKDIEIAETTDFSPEAFKKNRKRDGYLLKQMPNFSNVLFLACNNFFTFSRKLSQFSISLGKPKASTILPYR